MNLAVTENTKELLLQHKKTGKQPSGDASVGYLFTTQGQENKMLKKEIHLQHFCTVLVRGQGKCVMVY